MEPFSAILLAALSKVGDKVISDGYLAVKNYLVKKLGKDNSVTTAIKGLEDAPDSREKQDLLDQAVDQHALTQDDSFQSLVKALAEKTNTSNIQVNVSGSAKVQGVAGANTVTIGDMNFTNS